VALLPLFGMIILHVSNRGFPESYHSGG
jgi:hypothetical protein